MRAAPANPSLDVAIQGSPRSRFFLELFGNSAIFPIANILLEFFLEGGPAYFLEPDFYAIVFGALVQAAYLARDGAVPAPRFAGNLVGPAIYTAVEATIEGSRFFVSPHHVAYWAFCAVIGLLQEWRQRAHERHAPALLVIENVVRSSILLAMYGIYEKLSGGADTASLAAFFRDPSHRFIAWAIALLGVVAGLAAATSQRYLAMLRALSRRLRTYSEWLFGRALLEQAVSDPQSLALARRERAIVFMDVRGFTAWSERETPEAVVAALNAYYLGAEAVFERHPPVRFKFNADEVMAVFGEPREAAQAARDLAESAGRSLASHRLAAGVGVHWGPVVEGVMGAREVKSYDVLGDTVNTAKRIEGAAQGGEVLASEAFIARSGLAGEGARAIEAKGKSAPLVVHRIGAPAALVRKAHLDSGQAEEAPNSVT